MRTPALISIVIVSGLLAAGCDGDDSNGGVTTSTLASTTTLAPPTTIQGSTTTSTGVIGTSTTIVSCDVLQCDITWRVSNDVTLGALQIETDYAAAPGGIDGSGDEVDCTDLTGSLSTFNDNDAARKLNAGFISLTGIDAPAALMRCAFAPQCGGAPQPPSVNDFTVTVIDATDPALTPVVADVEVTSIQCGAIGGTTSTTSSTSTTIAEIRSSAAVSVRTGRPQ